jgi:hypothetical protein
MGMVTSTLTLLFEKQGAAAALIPLNRQTDKIRGA